MQIFEYPYVIITIFIICFVLLGAFGVYFAIRGVKTANGHAEDDLSSVSKLESAYIKAGKQRGDRCIMYIGISSDSDRSKYSEPKAFEDIKQILLRAFPSAENCCISAYADKNYVVFTEWNAEVARKNAESCLDEINKCLTKHSSLNLVSVRIGSYLAFGTNVSFDEAISRANQASMLAKKEGACSGCKNKEDNRRRGLVSSQFGNRRYFKSRKLFVGC